MTVVLLSHTMAFSPLLSQVFYFIKTRKTTSRRQTYAQVLAQLSCCRGLSISPALTQSDDHLRSPYCSTFRQSLRRGQSDPQPEVPASMVTVKGAVHGPKKVL